MDFTPISPLTPGGLGATAQELVYRGLFRVSAGEVPQADLAQSWRFSPDGKSLTVRLRDGLHFSDGAPLTAHDVVETLQAAKRAGTWGMDELIDLRALDRQTVITTPATPFRVPGGLATGVMKEGREPLGSGPFVVAKADSQHVSLRANPFYEKAPGVSAIEFHRFDQASEQWSNLLGRKVDLITFVPWNKYELLQAIPSIRMVSSLSSVVVELELQHPSPPFDRPAVRYALALAVNRDELVSGGLQGHGRPAHGVLWPNAPQFDATVLPYPYAPEAARRLLLAAGCTAADDGTLRWQGQPLQLHIYYSNFLPGAETLALLLERQLKAAGIAVDFADPGEAKMRAMQLDREDSWAILHYRHAASDLFLDREAQPFLAEGRPASLGDLQRRMRDQPTSIYLVWPDRLDIIDERYCGLPRLPDGPEPALDQVHLCAPDERN